MGTTPVRSAEPASDAQAWEALFRAHATRVVRLAALLGARDPEDVAAEAFVRVYAARDRVRLDDSCVPYLNRVIVNLVRDRARRERTAARRIPHGEPVASAEHEAQSRDERARVLAAVQALPQRRREALVLRYWSDLTYAQIAAALGCGPARRSPWSRAPWRRSRRG